MNKICNQCTKEKPSTEEFFEFRKDSNKLRDCCKECKSEKDKLRKQNLTEKEKLNLAIKSKINYEKNKKEIQINRKIRYEKNKELELEKGKIYYQKNKDKKILYQEKNSELINKSAKIRYKNKIGGNFETKDVIINRFKTKASLIHKNQYDYSKVFYINSNEKVEIICKEHGPFRQTVGNHLRSGCPICIFSKGEFKIYHFLRENNIKFEQEKSFDKIHYFDFYLSDLNICIEYDGRQHFEAIELFGGEEGLKKSQQRDYLKNQYCRNNNMGLLRIPYWDFENIEQILTKELITITDF